MEPEDIVATATTAAKNAKRAMVLTTFAVAVAVLVLAIDHGIKRSIVDEAGKARGLLAEVRDIATQQTPPKEEEGDGASEAGEGGTDSSPSIGAANGVVHDAPAGAVLGKAPAVARRPPARKPAGTGRRAPRNG